MKQVAYVPQCETQGSPAAEFSTVQSRPTRAHLCDYCPPVFRRSPVVPLDVELVHPRRAKPFHRPGWVYEEKTYDGWRIVAFKDGRRVRLISRRGREHTARFPNVAAAIARLSPRTLIFDGELCVFNAKLLSQFHLLMDPGVELATPPVFMVFDCLRLRGRDLRPLPLRRFGCLAAHGPRYRTRSPFDRARRSNFPLP